VVVHSHKREK